jgi:Ribonuclease G/E
MPEQPPEARSAATTCPRCKGTGRERSKEHTTRAPCWACGGSGRADDQPAATVDPLDALEEKWRTEPADLAEWSMRAIRTLALARKWKRAALEWEELARKEDE